MRDNFLDIPSLEIKRLLKLRGIKLKALAKAQGVSYHSLSKTLTNERRTNARIRKAIADALEIPFATLWGDDGKALLNSLIEEELKKKVFQEQTKYKALPPSAPRRFSLRIFMRNIMALGRYQVYWGGRER